jgi:hypothetical protein
MKQVGYSRGEVSSCCSMAPSCDSSEDALQSKQSPSFCSHHALMIDVRKPCRGRGRLGRPAESCLVATHRLRSVASCLAAGALLACSPEARSEAVLAYETATFDPKSPDPDIDFRIVFSQPPDFFTVDASGRQAIDFQYYTPESLIRGPEIYITRTTIRIRSYGLIRILLLGVGVLSSRQFPSSSMATL